MSCVAVTHHAIIIPQSLKGFTTPGPRECDQPRTTPARVDTALTSDEVNPNSGVHTGVCEQKHSFVSALSLQSCIIKLLSSP